MCMMCDGASLDELHFNVHGSIARHGWSNMAVEAAGDHPSWAYTIGLSAGFDHPELVVFGLSHLASNRLLNAIGEDVRHGEYFLAGDVLDFPDGSEAELLAVHPAHFGRDVFGEWLNYYHALGPPLPHHWALQLWQPEVCDVRLDRPEEPPGCHVEDHDDSPPP